MHNREVVCDLGAVRPCRMVKTAAGKTAASIACRSSLVRGPSNSSAWPAAWHGPSERHRLASKLPLQERQR